MFKKIFGWLGDALLNMLDDEPASKGHEVSPQLVEMIKHFEGFRKHPYRCSAGVWTIGYGTTTYPNGKQVTLSDQNIGEEYAEKLLISKLRQHFVPVVNDYVKKPLKQHEFDALVSFVYNIGAEAFAKSTLLRKLNGSFHKDVVAEEFLRWNKARNPESGELEPLEGLTIRRKAEAELYKTGRYP